MCPAHTLVNACEPLFLQLLYQINHGHQHHRQSCADMAARPAQVYLLLLHVLLACTTATSSLAFRSAAYRFYYML